MNNQFKKSIIKATRPGIIDVWNTFMVERADFTQNDHDIPFSPKTATKLPTAIIDWVEARQIYKAAIASGNKNFHYDAFVCFYVDDYKFDRPNAEIGTGDNIWTDYKYVLKVLRHFEGAITPDFSICQDFPEPVKIFNIYRMRAYGYWLGKQGIAILNNCRWGTRETYNYVWDGLPSDDILCLGTVGGNPRKLVDRKRFEEGLEETVIRRHPKILLTYGSSNYPCFDLLRKKGIEIVSYPSRTARVFEKGGERMSKGYSGLFKGTKGDNYHKRIAYQVVHNLINSTPGTKKKAMAVGAYDEKTGTYVATFAGEIPKKIHPKLRQLAERVGEIGSPGKSERNTVGVCAEFHAVNDMLFAGCKLEDIRLTRAIRPRTGKFMPYCVNCREMFSEIIARSE